MTFPPSPVPLHYTSVSSDDRNGIYYVGSDPTFTLNQSGADAYEIRYWGRDDTWTEVFGDVVSSGVVSGTTIEPDAPSFGWNPGWYRLHLTGPTNDAVFGHSYGAYTFIVIRNTTGFRTNPPAGLLDSADTDEPFVKSVLGIGSSRLDIGNAALVDLEDPYLPGVAPGNTYTGQSLWHAGLVADAYASYTPTDPQRPWPIMCQFPNSGTDGLGVPDVTAGNYLEVYCATGDLDGSQVFVRSDPGTTSGTKIRVYYPDSSTLVETFDNLGAGPIADDVINATSNYIKTFGQNTAGATMAATPIGNDYRQGVIDTITYLYPKGVHYYEGPSNEPAGEATTAHRMMLFQASVHQGNASAKAIGPSFVTIESLLWVPFLDAGGGDFCDEFSTHMYNSQTFGDFNLARTHFSNWLDLLESYGYGDKPIWSTESTHSFTSVYNSYQPRHARIPVLQTLTLEQFGVPREKNHVWYDKSHGFWNYPSWLLTEDGSPTPQCALYRTLAEETWGKLHHHVIDFGHELANHIFLGSVYKSPTYGTSTAVLVSHSALPDGLVKLSVDGTGGPVTVVDAWGNETTIAVTGGTITVPVSDIPVYVRLPVGADVFVNDVAPGGDFWGSLGPSVVQYARATTSNITPQTVLIDNGFLRNYGAEADGIVNSQGSTNADTVPDSAEVLFNSTVDVDRVVVFAGMPWQVYSTLVDFDVDTTANGGSSWTTRQTVTAEIPASLNHVTSGANAGCTFETYWDKQWIFDVKLPSTQTCNGVRVYARETSFGGEPNSAIVSLPGGQGNSYQHLCVEEIAVPSSAPPSPYTAGYTDLVAATSGLVRWYRLGEATGVTTAVDQVNAAHNGTYQISSADGPIAIPAAIPGDTGKQFINLGQIVIPHDTDLDFGDTFSIEFWVNSAGDDFSGGDLLTNAGLNTPFIRWETGVVKLFHPSPLTLVAHSSLTILDHAWHHVVVTKNGSATKIYIDGNDLTALDTNKTFGNDAAARAFGWRGHDELAFYNVALSSSDVFDHYNSSTTPTAVPTLTSFETPEPNIAGSADVDEQIQCSTGYWDAAPTHYAYQWQSSPNGSSSWANVGGATRSDYIIDSADLSKYLRCRVIASNVVGAGIVVSSNTVGPVGAAIDYPEEPPPVIPTGSRRKDRRTQGGSKPHGRIRRH